jgi:hypothetical protein
MLFDCFISWLYMRVSEANFWEKYISAYFSQVSDFQVWSIRTNLFFVRTSAVLPYADLAVAIRMVKWHIRTGSTGLRLASLFLPYTHLCIFIDLSWHVVCFSRWFFSRFWHSVHISSHPMIFIVSSVILLSLCAFRILEYLLGYFLEILCMKILFMSVCWADLLCLMNSCIAYISLWHPFDSRLKYHIIFGTNRI